MNCFLDKSSKILYNYSVMDTGPLCERWKRMSNVAYKFRIYPNKEQQILIIRTFGCCRKVWNLMLDDKKEYYEKNKAMLNTTPAKYKKEYPFLKEVDSLALANVQLNLQKAFKSFFNKKARFPKRKTRRHSKKSYTTNNVNKNIKIVDDRHIILPKLKNVKAKIHRSIPENYVIKSATISQERDGKFYCSILFEYEKTILKKEINTSNAIGLDYKSNGLYMDSNGNIGSNHKYYRESHKKLAKAQRKLSRKKGSKKGERKSKNYLKQLKKVNKIYKHISNQRLDNLHKLSTEIANQYDVVCVEELNMRAMSNKGFGNGKATLDNGFGIFLNMLEYKLNDRGKYFIKVDKWYPSSQICHCCGSKKKLTLEQRVYECKCGYVCDRDYNAAKNILDEGLRLLRENIA